MNTRFLKKKPKFQNGEKTNDVGQNNGYMQTNSNTSLFTIFQEIHLQIDQGLQYKAR